MTTMTETKNVWDEDPIILCIVLISITITLIGDFIKCLLTIHLPRPKQLVTTSQVTSGTPKSKAMSQPPSHSTNAPCVTVDQKKVVGTTSKDGQSKQSVSSPRSRPSVKPSSSRGGQKKSTENVRTTSDGTPGLLASATDTPKRSRKSVRTTAESQPQPQLLNARADSRGFA